MKVPVATSHSVIRLALGSDQSVRLVEVGRAGAPGLNGKDGKDGTDGVFTYTQTEPAATWTVTHNLGFIPNVHVEDADGTDMIGAISHHGTTETVIEFSEPVSGIATLS